VDTGIPSVPASSDSIQTGVSDVTSAPDAQHSFPCPKCGSIGVRKSKPKTGGEKLLRAAGIHFYRCPDCRQRGRHRGPIHRRGSTAPVRRSQRKAALRRKATVAAALALAALLGLGAGYYLQSSSGESATASQ
jgi:predicted RNA-binding Zn-ribbon protein involved in translation (DUF1610 family)